MLTRAFILAAAAGLLAGPGLASSDLFRAKNHMRVAQRDAAVIEVGGFTQDAGLDDYWCAVGDYLRRVQNTPWDQDIYVVRGLGPGQVTNSRDAVLFTLDPDAAGVTPLDKSIRVVSTLSVGRSKSVNSAFYSCGRKPSLFRD